MSEQDLTCSVSLAPLLEVSLPRYHCATFEKSKQLQAQGGTRKREGIYHERALEINKCTSSGKDIEPKN